MNLGTPDSPSVKDVRKYLKEFLNDPRVIDLPWLKRKLLVNLIIVPLRAPKSAKEYEKLWKQGNGASPLLTHGLGLQKEVQKMMPDDYGVHSFGSAGSAIELSSSSEESKSPLQSNEWGNF